MGITLENSSNRGKVQTVAAKGTEIKEAIAGGSQFKRSVIADAVTINPNVAKKLS
jgi:hypothetical protein